MTQEKGIPYQRHKPSAALREFLDPLDPGAYFDCGRARLHGLDDALLKEAESRGRQVGDDSFQLVATDMGLVFCRPSISFAIAARWEEVMLIRPHGEDPVVLPVTWPTHGELKFTVSKRLAGNIFRRWLQLRMQAARQARLEESEASAEEHADASDTPATPETAVDVAEAPAAEIDLTDAPEADLVSAHGGELDIDLNGDGEHPTAPDDWEVVAKVAPPPALEPEVDGEVAVVERRDTGVSAKRKRLNERGAERRRNERPLVLSPFDAETSLPIFDEPVAEEPPAEEPVVDESVAEEPLAEEPLVDSMPASSEDASSDSSSEVEEAAPDDEPQIADEIDVPAPPMAPETAAATTTTTTTATTSTTTADEDEPASDVVSPVVDEVEDDIDRESDHTASSTSEPTPTPEQAPTPEPNLVPNPEPNLVSTSTEAELASSSAAQTGADPTVVDLAPRSVFDEPVGPRAVPPEDVALEPAAADETAVVDLEMDEPAQQSAQESEDEHAWPVKRKRVAARQPLPVEALPAPGETSADRGAAAASVGGLSNLYGADVRSIAKPVTTTPPSWVGSPLSLVATALAISSGVLVLTLAVSIYRTGTGSGDESASADGSVATTTTIDHQRFKPDRQTSEPLRSAALTPVGSQVTPTTDGDPLSPARTDAVLGNQPRLCNSNYSGCVADVSDVDCPGDGDGPVFSEGPAVVMGEDVYDLDTDGDGETCEADQPRREDLSEDAGDDAESTSAELSPPTP